MEMALQERSGLEMAEQVMSVASPIVHQAKRSDLLSAVVHVSAELRCAAPSLSSHELYADFQQQLQQLFSS